MIQPVLSGEALLADIHAADAGEGFLLWWLGQSGFLVKSAEGCVLFDPYLSESLTRKYAETDKPHIRMTACPIDPILLDGIDVVTSSHNHTDHLDAETLLPLMQTNPGMRLVIPEANRGFAAQRLGCEPDWPIGLDDRQSVQLGGFRLSGVAAAHDQVERDPQGRCRYLGYVLSFGRYAIYHSGDTLWHADLVPQLSSFALDVVILPINGRLPRRRVAGNLWGQEAAVLANDVGARLAIPCHYEMFTFNTETPEAFIAKCRELDQDSCVLRCGERFIYPRPD